MGYNTVAVLLNDCHSEWPEDTRKASRDRSLGQSPLSGYFGWGRLLSQDHASGHQVVVVHGNTGSRMGPSEPATQADLDALAMALRPWPAPTCRVCGGNGWVWEPHAHAPFRHREDCPARCGGAS